MRGLWERARSLAVRARSLAVRAARSGHTAFKERLISLRSRARGVGSQRFSPMRWRCGEQVCVADRRRSGQQRQARPKFARRKKARVSDTLASSGRLFLGRVYS